MRLRPLPAAVLLALWPALAHAGAWTVPGTYDTIAETLTHASDWDSIYVRADSYAGEPPVTVTSNVGIMSWDGSPVAYPQFVVIGASLRLSDGVVAGTEEITTGAYTGYDQIYVESGELDLTRVTMTGGYDHGVYAIDSILWIEDSDFSGFNYSPAIEAVGSEGDTTVSLERGTVSGNGAGGVHVFNPNPVHYAWVGFTDVEFEGNSTFEYGGDARFYRVDLAEIEGGSSNGATAGSGGGSIQAWDTNVRITGTGFFDASAPYGGAIYAYNETSTHTIDIVDATFERCVADAPGDGAGGALLFQGMTATATNVTASAGEADYGGFAYISGGSYTMYDGSVEGVTATYGGGVKVVDGGEARVIGTRLCGNTALWGGALFSEDASLVAEDVLLHRNTAESGGAVWVTRSELTVTDGSIIGNQAGDGAITVAASSVSLVNDLFTSSPTGLVRDGESTVVAGYNLYWELDDPDTGYSTEGGDVYAAPVFVGSFDPDLCGSEPWLDVGSPALDAGYDVWSDEDGTRSDIGAFDGVGEPTDDTGVPTDDTAVTDDTARTDDTGSPGDDTAAPDADGDGTPDSADCDPDDPSVHPGATDDPFDDIDQDCDGTAATGTARGGCDCDTGGASAPSGLLLAALALARRRPSR